MTDGKDQSQAKPQASDAPDIIEAEVIREEFAAQSGKSNQTTHSSGQTSRAPWVISGMLAAFIGGVYSAPYFQEGLATLGLVDQRTISAPQTNTVDLKPMQTQLDDLAAQLTRHQEILGLHEQKLAAQKQGAEALEGQISSLSVAPSSGEAFPADLVALKADIERLTEDITRLASIKRGGNPAVSQLTGALAILKAETEQMRARFSAMEHTLASVQAGAIEASPNGRLLLALSRIKDRALAGLAFTTEIEGLRPDIAALSKLDQQLLGAELAVLQEASAGIDPYENLVAGFDAMAAKSLTAAQKSEGSFLSNLFTVRRTDEGASGNDAIFLAAEKKLTLHDVKGAVTELEKLEGAALASTEVWRTKAMQLHSVERAFDRLVTAISRASPQAVQAGGGA